MKKRITEINALQAGRLAGLCYFFITALFIPFFVVAIVFSEKGNERWFALLLLFVPLAYGAIGFLLGALTAFIYNFISRRFGGIEVTVEDVQELH